MNKYGKKIILACMIFGVLNVFLFAESMQNMLPNGGFAACKLEEKLPTANWFFRYNKATKGEFIADNSFKGESPVLKITNSLSGKSFSLVSGKIKMEEAGKYRLSVWLKAGADAEKVSNKNLSALLRFIRSDWKNGFKNNAMVIQKSWLKYEYDIYVPATEIGKEYWFRIDINGSGSFYVAAPSLKLVKETEITKKTVRKPLRETAHFSFDKILNEDNSKTLPSTPKKTKFVEGFKGQAVTVEDGGALSYQINDLLKGDSGSISLWFRTSADPVPTFVPTDPVGLSIIGQNQLGKTTELFTMRASAPGNFFTIKSAYGKISAGYCRPRKNLYGNEWRHLTYSWDKNSGLRVYLDGRPFLMSSASKEQNKYLSSQMKMEKIHLLTATGNKSDEKAFFDELRFFNRAMDADEALKLYEDYVSVYPVLIDYAIIVGSRKPLRVRMFHSQNSPAAEIMVQAETVAGKALFEKNISVSQTGDYTIPFYPAASGDYRLVFLYNNKRIRTFEVAAISDKSITDSMPESTSGNVKTILLEEIDCTNNYPSSRYLDDGKVRVTESSIGTYRESTNTSFIFNKPGGFAYNFTIKNPGKPHWLEIEYPDDKPRAFYVVVEQSIDNHGWGKSKYTSSNSLDTIGVANGVNNPVTGKMVRKRLLFWPDSKKIMVGCFGYKTLPGHAGPALKSIKIYENNGLLPRLKVNPPEGLPQRAVGNWNEDPSMPHECWFKKFVNNQGPTFDLWRDKLRRRVKYIRFTGQNQTIIQVFPYNGDNSGLLGIFPLRGRAIMPGWSCLAATIFNRENIPFYIQFNDRRLGMPKMVGLDKISKDALEAAAKGIDSIEFMTADGTFPVSYKRNTLNFLCPAVREAHLKRIRFYRSQFGIYDNFKGVSYFYTPPITFRNEKTGYGDYTIAMFEKETGIKIPVENKGIERFGKRYTWLKSSGVWNRWINWRCSKVTEFLLVLSSELNSGKKKGLKIIFPIHTETNHFLFDNLAKYPAKIDIAGNLRGMGVDISSLGKESSLIVEPVSAPNYGLLYKKQQQKNLDSFWYSDNFAELIQSSKFPAFMLSRHANMEIHGSCGSGIKKFWWPFGYWGNNGGFACFSSALPSNQYLPQTLAWTLANCDVRHVDHGWWGNPENGAYERFQKFYQAYRAIPAVPFNKVSGVNDPVMVRQYNSSDNESSLFRKLLSLFSSSSKPGWFYLVNTQSYKTKVKITFDSNVELTDAVINRSQKVNGNSLIKELEPYQVACFRSKKPLNIVKVEQLVPENIIERFEQVVTNLKIGAKLSPSPQTELLVKAAKKMLKEKRYSTFYYLSRSYSALQLLKEAKKPVVFKINLHPDSKVLNIEVSNRMAKSISGNLTLKVLPEGLSCSEITQKFSLGVKERKRLTFSLKELELNKISCCDELEFEFEYQVDHAKAKNVKYVFRPIIATMASNLKIDGDLSDWNKAKWNKLVKCATPINIKGLKTLGPFKSEFATKWNKKGFYLAVRVNEKDFIPAGGVKAAWHYDFFEVMFDQKNNTPIGVNEMDKDDCVFNVCNIKNKPTVVTLNPAGGQSKNMASHCIVKRVRKGNETRYEMLIPANVLNQASFKPGANIGFALKLHNREHAGNSNLDLWNYAVSTPGYPCNNPNVWNDLLLSENAD